MQHEKKTFAVAEVKSAESDNTAGEFEIIMSTDAVDRDGESIVKGAFDPLPESIPVHAFHDFHDPVGRAFPAYNEAGQLVGRGFFANTPRAQEIRQLVADGVIGHTSVGFMAAERKSADGVPEIASAELLEVSFVSVPSNRDAAVLAVKELSTKRAAVSAEAASLHINVTSPTGSSKAEIGAQVKRVLAGYSAKAGARNAAKDAERLQNIHDLAVTNGAICAGTAEATPAPEAPSVEDGKSPASNVVEMARIRADIARLSLED